MDSLVFQLLPPNLSQSTHSASPGLRASSKLSEQNAIKPLAAPQVGVRQGKKDWGARGIGGVPGP